MIEQSASLDEWVSEDLGYNCFMLQAELSGYVGKDYLTCNAWADWLTDWLIDWSIDWLTDWSIDWLTNCNKVSARKIKQIELYSV